eukprot:TRINITY_DN26798_c0_g1_i1.p1 TRINITY_DN26798_c0_g1~~TRINITY_DN26798_c0_g1_i1.p1  ORF type:complete len:424 (+),score=68.05 TRINITY_DN26798_c0_g1_i1:76-1272(+)
MESPSEPGNIKKGQLRGGKRSAPRIQQAAYQVKKSADDLGEHLPEESRKAVHAALNQNLAGVAYDEGSVRLGSRILIDDLLLGVQLSCLAYTDDEENTVAAYDTPLLKGTLHAIEEVAGGRAQARKPLTEILCNLGWTADRIFSSGTAGADTQGYIAHTIAGDIALVFRGTTNIMDTAKSLFDTGVNDSDESFLMCKLMCSSQPKVHAGFNRALSAVLHDIDTFLLPQLESKESKCLVVAGHSLGGAVAHGAVAYLLTKFDFAASPHKLIFVTLGSPRYGDEHFVAWLTARLRKLQRLDKCRVGRLVNDHDIVTTVPPCLLGFQHIPDMCLLTHSGELLIDPETMEARNLDNALDSISEFVQDHEPIKYLELLSRVAKQQSVSALSQAAKGSLFSLSS